MPSSQCFSDVSPGSLFAEVSPTGQYVELVTSSAGVAPTNEARIRLNGGVLQVSISGAAYVNIDTGTGIAIGEAVTSGTVGSVLFVGSAGLAQDNANLFWDDTLNYLGIGTAAAPASPLHVTGSISPAAAADASVVTFAGTIVEAASGVHALLTGVKLTAPTVTVGVATVTDTAVLYVAGAMTATVTGTNYALWVDAGTSRFDGVVLTGVGAAATPALAVGELTTGLYQTGTGATSVLRCAVNGTYASALESNGQLTLVRGVDAAGAVTGALSATHAAGGATVGSAGYDVHTAGLCYVGKTTATGVALSKVGGVSTAYGTFAYTIDGIAAGTDAAISLVNTTASTAGATVQNSPMVLLTSHVWDADTLVDDQHDWSIQNVGEGGFNTTPSYFTIAKRVKRGAGAMGAWSNLLTIRDNGDFLTTGNLTAFAFYGKVDTASAVVLTLGGTTATGVQIGPGAALATGTPTTALITQAIHTGGASTIFKVTGAALTGQTALTEASDVVWDLSRTVTFANGTITLQRQAVFDIQTTLNFTSASASITNVGGMHITAGPTQGANAIFGNIIGLLIGGVGTDATAATTVQTTATGATFAQVKLSADTVSYLGATNMTSGPAVSGLNIGQLTVVGDTATLTIDKVASLYIAGAPVAGANVVLTKTYSLWIDAGLPRIDSATVNGSVATVLGSVGPTGAQTTVQTWLTVDIDGTTRYIPCF